MAMLVTDSFTEERLKAERAAAGADRFDEVWDGVYIMAPLPNDEHQEIATSLGAVLRFALGLNSAHKVYVGVNVSDREVQWEHNYRAPDIAVYLSSTQAKNCGTHWHGGPDFAVEIVSKDDRSREKLPFYAQVGTRELLLIDRNPWTLELYRLQGDRLEKRNTSSLLLAETIDSTVLPLSFRLLNGEPRPQIGISATGDSQSWLV
jgi:Uma2 family endonuclease